MTPIQVASLPGHKLSVVQLAFSPDDAWLISASRDRQWSLYKKVDAADSAAPYAHLLTMSKAHARIIWYVIKLKGSGRRLALCPKPVLPRIALASSYCRLCHPRHFSLLLPFLT